MRWLALALVSLGLGCSQSQEPAITVSPAMATLAIGERLQLAVTRQFPGGPVETVTDRVSYTSSNELAIAISPTGELLAGAQTGAIIVNVADHDTNATGSATFTVAIPARLTSVVVSPNPATIAAAGTLQLSALGIYDDGSTRDVTRSVAWSSSSAAVITVDATGVAHGVAAGEATVTATGETARGSAVAKVP